MQQRIFIIVADEKTISTPIERLQSTSMSNKDPCKKAACEIQKCLQANNYQEDSCLPVIKYMVQCCRQWEHLQTVSCSGFFTQSMQDKISSQGTAFKMVNHKLFAPSADRNKDPILEILQKYFPNERNNDCHLSCLEISSGTGQHIVHFAKNLPFMTFQPSEFTLSNLPSIQEYIVESGLTNILSPLAIDITSPIDQWNLSQQNYDLILNINMIHISPWQCTVSLFEKASELLSSKGVLMTYGPYAFHGVISPESNINFDRSLKARDEQWGLRDIDDLKRVANENGLKLEEVEDMPSNNKSLIWKRI